MTAILYPVALTGLSGLACYVALLDVSHPVLWCTVEAGGWMLLFGIALATWVQALRNYEETLKAHGMEVDIRKSGLELLVIKGLDALWKLLTFNKVARSQGQSPASGRANAESDP